MDFPKFDELFEIAARELAARSDQLSYETILREGTDANALAGMAALIGDECISQIELVADSVNLDSAKGTALDALIWDRYRFLRKPASPSYVSVTISAPVVTESVTIATGQQFSTSTSPQVFFRARETVTFLAGETSCLVACESVKLGSSQNVKIGAIANIVSPLSNTPANTTYTNLLAAAGGDDPEKDSDFRNRARMFEIAVQKGTLAALEFGALSVPGVRKASAFEALDLYGRPRPFTSVIVTDPFTEALAVMTEPIATYQAQSQILASVVQAKLDAYKAAGAFIRVIVAEVQMQTITLALSFTADANKEDTTLRARVAVYNDLNSRKPGEAWKPSQAIEALKGVSGSVVTGGEIVSPVGTVYATPLQVLRTALPLVRALAFASMSPLQNSLNPDAFV